MMAVSKENLNIEMKISEFEVRIEVMHLDFYKFYQSDAQKVPEWERLEQELLHFSRRKIFDVSVSKNLDRVLYKFQNRKKIWLNWLEESHHIS